MPLPDGEFTSVVFMMLHHVPTAQDQDRLFAEAFRVLARGVFAGSDGVHSFGFRLVHRSSRSRCWRGRAFAR